MFNRQQEKIIRDGLTVARRVCDAAGECATTMFALRSGRPTWYRPIALQAPNEYARVAEQRGFSSVVVVGSRELVDQDEQAVRLTRLYAILVNAEGQILLAGRQQRWHDSTEWSAPFFAPESLQTLGWRV